MELSSRQKQLIQIIKEKQPISGDSIAEEIGLSKPTLRTDLTLLTMLGILDARPKVGYIYTGEKVESVLMEKLYGTPVKELMIPAIFIHQNTTLKDAITDLFMYDSGSLYVVDEDNNLVGLLSRKDLLRGVLANDGDTIPVAVVMSRMPNIITITPHQTILEAGSLLMAHQVDSLPVVERASSQKIVGKLTKTRVMNYFIEEGLKLKEE